MLLKNSNAVVPADAVGIAMVHVMEDVTVRVKGTAIQVAWDRAGVPALLAVQVAAG